MAQLDDSVWNEMITRIEALEVSNVRLTQEVRELQDRVYQPYRVKPAEPWPPESSQ